MDLKLGDTRLIIDACKAAGLLRNQVAYVLATAFHETAHTMKPVREYGGEKYLKSKAYYPYVGMGYVQLTWKNNYEKAGKELGVDFLKNPRLLLQSKHAAPILVTGMKEGWFTGKCLADYITLSKSDFTGARKIINGTDKARLIADIAIRYDGLLKADGYGGAPVQPAPVAQPFSFTAAPAGGGKLIIETTQKRLAELGYNPGSADGKLGPLTKGAILSFKNDHGMQPSDTIDEDLIAAMASAQPRKMVPERANATTAEVAKVVPEVRSNLLTRMGAKLVGIPAAGLSLGVGSLDYLGTAKGYIDPIKETAGDVPGWVWIGLVAIAAAGLYIIARRGVQAGVDAFQSGDRR